MTDENDDNDDEDRLLRSVTLQNAKSIFLARRRAEEELVRTKEALERKTHELAHSLAMMRATLESTTDGILVTDGNGNVTGFNDKFAGMWGLSVEIMESRQHRQLLEVTSKRFADPKRFLGMIDDIYTASPAESYDLLELSDGRVFERFSRIQFVAGRNEGRVWSFRDITERRLAEETLREQSERLRVTLASIGDAVITTDIDGKVLSLNGVAQSLTGWTQHEAHGRPLPEVFRILTEATREPAANPAERVLKEGRIVGLANGTLLLARDGTQTPIDDSAAPIRDDKGGMVGVVLVFRDISQRKEAEEALRHSERELADFFETAAVGLQWVASDGTILRANQAELDLLGYSRDEYVGRNIAEFHVEQNLIKDILRRLTAGETVRDCDARMRCKDGSIKHVVLDSSVLWQDGEFVHTRCFTRDVTEKKLAEAALRRSETQFKQLANALPQIVWTARPDGFVDYYNERWYEFTGFPRHEYGDQSWSPIIHPDDVQRCADTYYDSIRSGHLYQIEYRFKDRRTGGYRWFLGRAYPVQDDQGAIVRWFGTCTDIDDTKKTAESTRFLADSSAALAELSDYRSTLQKVASLAVPFFADWCAVDMLESDGSVGRVAVTHMDPAKVQLVRELFRRYPPSPSDPHGVMKVLRTGESDWAASVSDSFLIAAARDEEHLRIIRGLGLKSFICTPIRSRARTLGVLTFVMTESGRVYDATDLAAAEDLAHRVAIALENTSLLSALKESDRRKDEFLAMLAHELRNPLAPIRNAVQVFRGKGPPEPDLQWATEVIDRQVHQMTRLVDDLLDVSRITRGKIELRKEVVELASVIKNAVEACRPLIEKRGHELTVTMPPDAIRVEADPTRLAQVLSNLLNNAAKYMNLGGRIGVRVEASSNQVLIRVKDTGIGIPADMVPHIFDMFTQVDGSSERSEGGLGIGLTLVKNLVEMHDGTVQVDSNGVGHGSEFVVRLPIIIERSRPSPSEPAGIVSIPTIARRILVVDDNQDSAESLALVLKLAGNDTHIAYDGVEAVEAAGVFRPDVILLDIGLPKLNGYDAARKIREEPWGKSMVLIALTGWGQEEDRQKSRDAGFNAHIVKPVDHKALTSLLASLPLQSH